MWKLAPVAQGVHGGGAHRQPLRRLPDRQEAIRPAIHCPEPAGRRWGQGGDKRLASPCERLEWLDGRGSRSGRETAWLGIAVNGWTDQGGASQARGRRFEPGPPLRKEPWFQEVAGPGLLRCSASGGSDAVGDAVETPAQVVERPRREPLDLQWRKCLSRSPRRRRVTPDCWPTARGVRALGPAARAAAVARHSSERFFDGVLRVYRSLGPAGAAGR